MSPQDVPDAVRPDAHVQKRPQQVLRALQPQLGASRPGEDFHPLCRRLVVSSPPWDRVNVVMLSPLHAMSPLSECNRCGAFTPHLQCKPGETCDENQLLMFVSVSCRRIDGISSSRKSVSWMPAGMHDAVTFSADWPTTSCVNACVRSACWCKLRAALPALRSTYSAPNHHLSRLTC